MPTNRKIIEALKTIKTVCDEHNAFEDFCEHCPLSDGNRSCLVSGDGIYPEDWKINEDLIDERILK